MRQSHFGRGAAATALLALLSLGGCGGGGEIIGGEVVIPGRTVEIVDGPASKIITKGGTVLRLSATAASVSKSLTAMKWTVTPVTPGAPQMTLTDADCASAVKNDIGGSISSSTWACKTSTVAPALSKDATYQVLVTGVDSGGATASRMSEIFVAAVPAADLVALRPVVVTTPFVTVRGGAEAGLTCSGTPGVSAVSDALSYSWTIKSNPNGLSLSMVDESKSTMRFTPPAVTTGNPKQVTFECAVKDSNGHTATADVQVKIATDADSVPPPTVIGSSTRVQLYSGLESQLSCLGSGGYIANDGGALRYRWVVKSNASGVLLDMVGSDQPTVRIKPGTLPPSVTDPKAPVTLQCRVTDDANRTSTVDIPADVNRYESVTAANTVIANAGVSKYVQIGEIVILDGSASKMVGVDNAQLYYSWRQVSGVPVSLSNGNSAKPSFRAPNEVSATTLRFELTVSSTPITATYVAKPTEVAFVDITVASAAAPRITLPDVTVVGGGVPHNIYATVNDNPEARPVYFRWTQVSGTPVVIQTPNLSAISFFTPIVPGAFEDLVFNVEASFDPAFPAGATASQDAIVRVTGTGS